LQIPLVAGRTFDRRDTSNSVPVAIVNSRAAQQLFGSEAAAIGRRVRLGPGPWREVVGVVGNVRSSFFNTLEWQTSPIVYRPAEQAFAASLDPAAAGFGFSLHVRSNRQFTLTDMRDLVTAVDPRAAVGGVTTAPELIGDATRQPSIRMMLLFWFGAASLLLAAVGVYGVVAQTVTQRVREIAIRLALGAPARRVMGDVVRRALLAGAAGIVAGSLVMAIFGSTAKTVLYGVQPNDLVSFAAAAFMLITVTAVAALIPAVRAGRVEPIRILRGE
jgi:hypothetical protein